MRNCVIWKAAGEPPAAFSAVCRKKLWICRYQSLPCVRGGGSPVGDPEGLKQQRVSYSHPFGKFVTFPRAIPQSASLPAPLAQGSLRTPVIARSIANWRGNPYPNGKSLPLRQKLHESQHLTDAPGGCRKALSLRTSDRCHWCGNPYANGRFVPLRPNVPESPYSPARDRQARPLRTRR